MKTYNNESVEPMRSVDALFRAPAWAAKMELVSVFLFSGSIAAGSAGVALSIVLENAAPVVVGLVIFSMLFKMARVLKTRADQSLSIVYSTGQVVQSAGPQQTVIAFPKTITVRGESISRDEVERITVNAPADEVQRMLHYIHGTGITARVPVTSNAKVSQGTWSKVMAALEQAGAVVNNGRSGYSLTDELDAALDKLDAKLR